jgi:hypothetical protein
MGDRRDDVNHVEAALLEPGGEPPGVAGGGRDDLESFGDGRLDEFVRRRGVAGNVGAEDAVRLRVSRICSRNCSAVQEPAPSRPRPPALLTAATSGARPILESPPRMMG